MTVNTKLINVHTLSCLQKGTTCSFLSLPFFFEFCLPSPVPLSPDISQELLSKGANVPVVFLNSLSNYALHSSFNHSFLINQSHQLLSLHFISSPIGGKAGCEPLPHSQELWEKKDVGSWEDTSSLTVPPEVVVLCGETSHDSRIFPYIPSLRKNSSRPVSGSAQDIAVQMKTPNRSPLLTRCLQISGYFPPYTLTNVVSISCNHKKTNFRIFFFNFCA